MSDASRWTGRFLKLPADDSRPTRVRVAGVELPKAQWSLRHGGFDQRLPNLPRRERAATPPAFRDLLLSIARSALVPR